MIFKFAFTSIAVCISLTSSVGAETWTYGEEVNPFTGKLDAWTSIQAISPTIGGQVLEPHMRLFLSCLEGNLDISLNTGVYIGNSRANVRYRFDESETIVEKWVPSADGLAVFVPRKFQDFRTGLSSASALTIEVVDFRGVAFRTVFEGLENNRTLLETVKATCEG
jgi:secreted protein with Ig-like and vWFA domain